MTAESPEQLSSLVGGAPESHSPLRSQPEETLQLRLEIHLIGGSSGRAQAAAQGRALRAILASVGQTEVRPGQEPFQ